MKIRTTLVKEQKYIIRLTQQEMRDMYNALCYACKYGYNDWEYLKKPIGKIIEGQ